MVFIKEYEIVEIDNDNSIIINLMNGNADLLDKNVVSKIRGNTLSEISKEICELLVERGYLFETEEKYLDYLTNFNNTLLEKSKRCAPNFIYIPTYGCNLNCYYCFEKAYEKNADNTDININRKLNIFFEMVEKVRGKLESENNTRYKDEEILITLTGGEPLLISNYQVIEKFLQICNEKHYTVAVVTNGTTIQEFANLLIKYNVRDIQITLDGSKEIHDSIRKYHDGAPSFEQIMRGIDLLSKYSNEVSVRINVTKKNIHSLVDLENIMEKYKNVMFYVYLLQQECIFQPNSMTVPKGLHAIPLQTARSAASV